MTKIHIIPIILMFGLLLPSAMAYTELSENTITGATWYTNMHENRIIAYNGSVWGDITKIEQTVHCGILSGANRTGTEEVRFRNYPTTTGDYGYATRTWDIPVWSGAGHAEETGTITYVFHNATDAAGANKVIGLDHVSGDMPWAAGNAYCYYGTGGDYGAEQYDVKPSAGFSVNSTSITYTGAAELPSVNFTGYPLDGYSPLDVAFTVLNATAVNATGARFSYGDGQLGTTTTGSINHTYQNPGIYTVSMNFFNLSGIEETIVKNNYVLASVPTGMIVNLDVKNAITGALIQDSTVSIRNTSSGVWRNTTAPTGLVYFSTTDPGYLYPLSQNQSITLAANKSGYRDASETFSIPYNNYRARLFLMPTSVTNATGAGTVVVNVIRNKDGLTVSGMSVVADTGQIGVTNSAGAVTLYNVTAGARVIKVSDPDGAYQPTEKSITLTAGETKLVVIQVVLNGESPVDTPVTPTPTGTFDPSDPGSYGEYGNYTSSEMNQAGGFVILQMLGQLFSLWPLVVMGIFFKFMKSAFT